MNIAEQYKFNQFPATEDNSHIFECFWSLEVNGDFELPEERIIPDTSVELIFNFGSPFDRTDNNGKKHKSCLVSLIGQRTEFIKVQEYCPVNLFAVRFTPTGLYQVTGNPQHLFAHQLVNGVDIFGAEIEEIAHKIKNIHSSEPDAKIKLLNTYFLNKVSPAREDKCQEIRAAITFIKKNNGDVTIDEIAESVLVHPKKLERGFKEFVGLNPKKFCKMVRMIALTNDLIRKTPFTEILHKYSFTDQSHLNKVIKEFTGTSPSSFIQEKNNSIVAMLTSDERMSNFYKS